MNHDYGRTTPVVADDVPEWAFPEGQVQVVVSVPCVDRSHWLGDALIEQPEDALGREMLRAALKTAMRVLDQSEPAVGFEVTR